MDASESASLIDHFVSAGDQTGGYLEAERLCGFQIDREDEVGGLGDWDIRYLRALENLTHRVTGEARFLGEGGAAGPAVDREDVRLHGRLLQQLLQLHDGAERHLLEVRDVRRDDRPQLMHLFVAKRHKRLWIIDKDTNQAVSPRSKDALLRGVCARGRPPLRIHLD
jgi:hypothetical protein